MYIYKRLHLANVSFVSNINSIVYIVERHFQIVHGHDLNGEENKEYKHLKVIIFFKVNVRVNRD